MFALPSLSAIAFLAVAAQADQTREFALVRDGTPLATIVVAAEPAVAAAFAAEELQDHVRRITGATLPEYQDYMDWYCPLTSVYDAELSARLRQQGKQVWWYVCCGPPSASADFPTWRERREPGFGAFPPTKV